MYIQASKINVVSIQLHGFCEMDRSEKYSHLIFLIWRKHSERKNASKFSFVNFKFTKFSLIANNDHKMTFHSKTFQIVQLASSLGINFS